MIDDAITDLTPTVGVKAACEAVGRPPKGSAVDAVEPRIRELLLRS